MAARAPRPGCCRDCRDWQVRSKTRHAKLCIYLLSFRSGKTLAFGIPALARLITSPRPNDGSSTISVLVVAPTRELALQTHDTLSALGGPLGIASVAVFGGVPKDPQVRMLRNLNKGKDGLTTRVVVGTPGRILDLVQDGVCDLSQCVPSAMFCLFFFMRNVQGKLPGSG
jgi:hypothetical protein